MPGSERGVDLRQESAIPLPSVCRRPPPRPCWLRPRPLARRAAGLLAVLALLPSLQGCSNGRMATLHVVVVPLGRMRWLRASFRDRREWQPLLEKFQALHPRVAVHITEVEQEDLRGYLARAHGRGLGPDLLLLRAPVANSLLAAGLVAPLPPSGTLASSLAQVEPGDLRRVSSPRGVAGLPFFSNTTLACYDRRRVQAAPTSVADLLALAARGRPIGLALDPTGIWWTVGAFGSHQAMLPLVTGQAAPAGREAADRAAISGWLRWLHQSALQSGVDIASGPQELTEALERGRLTWIPCYSLMLRRLEHHLGPHLGVAPLPAGPGGPPSPFSDLEVWSLGVDSSPSQRRLALALAEISLNPLVQRQITLQTRMLLPANRLVSIPVASSGRLAALAQAQDQFKRSSHALLTPYSIDRAERVLPSIESLLSAVSVGVMTPEQGAGELMNLMPRR